MKNNLIPGAKGAAEFTGLTQSAIYHMVEKGNLPVIRKGKRLYFLKTELEKAFSSEASA